jgi:hypothetical protein
MKKIMILLFFLCSNATFSQNPIDYKNKDTVYIVFDESEKFEDLYSKNEVSKYSEVYKYVFPDAKTIVFQVNLIKSVPLPSVIKKKRSFLENKSLKIITINEIHNLGYDKLLNLIHVKNLTVYIINKKCLKKRKIILKQAVILNIENMEM